jgi:hypothetical protein
MTPPVLKVGWQVEQSANSKDLTFSYNPKSYRKNLRLADYTIGTPPNYLNGDGTKTSVKAPYFPSI